MSEIVSHMKTYGEILDNETVVSRVLRTLTKDFDHVVAVIKESKDLSKYSFDKLMGSLLAHEARINMFYKGVEEKAFQVKGESPYKAKTENSSARGKGRGSYRGRGRGRGGGQGKGQFGDQHQSKSNLQCRYWKKFGHKEEECWSKQRNKSKEANFVTKVVEERVTCSWFTLPPIGILLNYGLWIVDAQIICQERRVYLKSLMSLKKVKCNLETISR